MRSRYGTRGKGNLRRVTVWTGAGYNIFFQETLTRQGVVASYEIDEEDRGIYKFRVRMVNPIGMPGPILYSPYAGTCYAVLSVNQAW